MLVAAEPPIPCSLETTFAWSFHLAYRARLTGRDLLVWSWRDDADRPTEEEAEGWLLSTLEPTCEQGQPSGRWGTWLTTESATGPGDEVARWACADWEAQAAFDTGGFSPQIVHLYRRSPNP